MKSKETIKGLIVKKPQEALEYLAEVVDRKEDTATFNAVLLIESQLSDLNNHNMQGTIALDDFTLGIQKIRNNILNVIEQAGDQYFSEEETEIIEHKDMATLFQVFALLRDLLELKINEALLLADPVPSIGSYTNVKRHIILNQIIKLLRYSNIELSSVEYRVIAEAFQGLSDDIKAEEYFKKALNVIDEFTDSTNSKIVAIRSYGNFLYAKGKSAEGLKQYQSAIIDGTSQEVMTFNGYTYRLIFGQEADFGHYEVALEFYKKAVECFNKITNPTLRNNSLNALNAAWEAKKMPATMKR
jgi:tetratricopeptide (TPR) repeat protein